MIEREREREEGEEYKERENKRVIISLGNKFSKNFNLKQMDFFTFIPKSCTVGDRSSYPFESIQHNCRHWTKHCTH
jgi:hypothetical protein